MRISDWSSDVCSSDLLAADQRGGERRAPDRAAQLRPQMRHCADVVLVAMGQQQAVQPVAMPDDRLDVGQDDVETRHAVVGEGDAEIDHQPPAGVAVPVQVHADLARPAERSEAPTSEIPSLKRTSYSVFCADK